MVAASAGRVSADDRRCRMPSSSSVFVFASALVAALVAPPAQAQSAHDAHAAHSHATQAQPDVAPAQRWATDAPLRDGMRRIRQAVQALDHYEHGHLDAVQAGNTAKLIDDAVNGMIAACKLKPDADAALHGLLVKFLAGSRAVRESGQADSRQAPAAAIADMRVALARYPQLFDDPGWKASGN